jgi:tetratricopeptide (TPR) repeat protein
MFFARRLAQGGAAALVGLALPVGAAQDPEVTFSERVAPIVFEHCLPCHRAGESAPFQLLTYEEVKKRARQIVEVTSKRYMPPWLPAEGVGEFEGDRSLSTDELRTFARWLEAGTPEGDPARLPSPPLVVEGWQLGEPDLVLSMPAPFVVPEEGLDVYRNFVLPMPVSSARFVEAVALRPGNKRVVHHAVMRVDRTSSSRETDAQDAEPGFPGMEMALSESPDGQFLGWTPGRVPQRASEGMAWTLQPGMDLVVQLHMVPTGKPEPIQIAVGLYFTTHPPHKRSMVLRLRNEDLDIPPGERAYVAEDSLLLPVPVAITRIYPHAHYLGKRMEVFAEGPGGARTELLRIDDWDFNWQDEYQYARPVELAAGTRLEMRYTYDNSAENPRQLALPPQRVRFGNRSADEMATLTLQVLAADVAARRALGEAVARHRVELYPEFWVARLNLGAVLAEQGQLEEAARHLRAGIALEPSSVDLHMNLGGVLAGLKQFAEAQRSLEEALRLRPGDPRVLGNLASLEAMQGNWERVLERYQGVLVSSPNDSAALRGLGTALLRLARLSAARAAFEKALALDARDFIAHYQLARVAFREQRLEEATAEFQAGLAIQPTSEAYADLARVYTARGMTDEAREANAAAKQLQKRPSSE